MQTRSTPRFRWWDYPIFLALTALHLSVLAVILYRWIALGDWDGAHPVFLFLLATIAVELMLWESRWAGLPLMRVPESTAPQPGLRVGVAVTFVPNAESIEMLESTVRALVDMDYSHDTWVLDEGDSPAVRQLCVELGAKHFTRAGIARYQQSQGPFKAHTKYGNYNAWLEEVAYEAYDVVVAFDSDHVAQANYLTSTLGYFQDPEIGYVQPAQVYSNQNSSFIARAAAEETYAYYSVVQMSAFAVGYPIVVGCHNAHRVSALREIGGFAQHEADDMVMTLLYRSHGWRGVFVPKVLARGLTPTSWSAYLRQQRRWARSVLDFKLRVFPRYSSRLPWLERVLTYVHGLYYLRGPIIGLQLVLLSLMLMFSWHPAGTGIALLQSLGAVWLTIMLCEAFRQRFYLDPKRESGFHWRAMFVAFVKWPYFVLAFWDALRADYGHYTITPKARPSAKPLGFGVAHAAMFALVFGAWLVNVSRGPSSFLAVHLAAGLAVITSLLAVVTATWSFPAAFGGESQRHPALHRARRHVSQRPPAGSAGRGGGGRVLSRAVASPER
jgi:cellulose synthase/poly-beta-1,6-N-acetylglucosamine synthase-like glycosyltransferase